METPNYYAIIPANIRYSKELSMFQKLLYAEITALTDKTWYCWASNKYFAELYGKNPTYISWVLNNLYEKWFIEIVVNQEKWNSRKIYIWEITRWAWKIVKSAKIPIQKNKNSYTGKPEDPYSEKPEHNSITNIKLIKQDNLTKVKLEQSSKTTLKDEDLKIDDFLNPLSKEKSKNKFWDTEINSILTLLQKAVWIDEFKETKEWQRRYSKNFVSFIKKHWKEEFLWRLKWVLENSFKAWNCNSIKYLYWEIKSFIHSPVVDIKNNLNNKNKIWVLE